ncbi:MAG: flagellin [Planctomycetaceae bacterium]
MALVISNNVSSLMAQNNLNRTSSALGKSIERLSSGLKVNRGADGPAALVISEKQRAQISGLRQAIENSEKAVSVVQTAEGALNEINGLLTKVRSLALDSANTGVNDDDALAANQAEITNALETIDRIANNTQFASKKLLDGSAGIQGVTTDSDVTFLTADSGSTSAGTYEIAVTQVAERATETAGTAQTEVLAADETLTVNGVSITLNEGLSRAEVQSRINEFTGQTGVVAEDDPAATGATRLRTEDFGASAQVQVVSNIAAGSDSSGFGTTQETDTGQDIQGTIGGAAASGVGNVLTSTAGSAKGTVVSVGEDAADKVNSASSTNGNVTITDNSLTFQVGANANQTVDVSISAVNPTGLGLGVSNNQFTNLSEIEVTSASKASDALAIIDQAIDNVTNLRGELGAFQQNTLESNTNNLRATLENSVNAESVIRDTDFAEEIANFTKQQILMQAGTSTLGNANQSQQLILSLLG